MSGYLLDTNVISEFSKPKPEPRVHAWLNSIPNDLLFTSVLNLAELRRGVLALPQSAKRTRLEAWLDAELTNRMGDRILPIDAAVAERWAKITSDAEKLGRPLPTIDSLLAATALHYNLMLVTRDVGELAITGVDLFNPWNS